MKFPLKVSGLYEKFDTTIISYICHFESLVDAQTKDLCVLADLYIPSRYKFPNYLLYEGIGYTEHEVIEDNSSITFSVLPIEPTSCYFPRDLEMIDMISAISHTIKDGMEIGDNSVIIDCINRLDVMLYGKAAKNYVESHTYIKSLASLFILPNLLLVTDIDGGIHCNSIAYYCSETL